MNYRFAEGRDFSDFASGSVFVSLPGRPAFPVRLASEIFQRCLEFREQAGGSGPAVLYDPCCGSGYLLGTVGFLHRPKIARLIGSDIDEAALQLTARNLALTSGEGLVGRMAEIRSMIARHDKPAYQEALARARRLKEQIQPDPMPTTIFQADVLRRAEIAAHLTGRKIDVVMTDIPYGRTVSWQAPDSAALDAVNLAHEMLDTLLPVLDYQSVIAVASRKKQVIRPERYQCLKRLQVGKRQIMFLKPDTG